MPFLCLHLCEPGIRSMRADNSPVQLYVGQRLSKHRIVFIIKHKVPEHARCPRAYLLSMVSKCLDRFEHGQTDRINSSKRAFRRW